MRFEVKIKQTQKQDLSDRLNNQRKTISIKSEIDGIGNCQNLKEKIITESDGEETLTGFTDRDGTKQATARLRMKRKTPFEFDFDCYLLV